MQSRLVLNGALKLNTIRSLSSAPKSDFVFERRIYDKKVGNIRKQWKTEIEEKLEKARLEKIEEDRKKTLVSAVKLRRDREEHLIKAELVRKANLISQQAARERMELSHIKFREKQARQQRRYAMAIADLEKEKEYWITPDNIENKINLSLFETPATTGLSNRYSDYWRYSAFTTDLDRMKKDEDERERYGFDAKAREIEIGGEREMVKRVEMMQFLDQSVSSGAERANFKNLVNEFLDHLKRMDGHEEDEAEDDDDDYDDEEDDELSSDINVLFEEDHSEDNALIMYDGDERGETLFGNREFVPLSSEYADDDKDFVDELIPLNEVEDHGDYKKKVVDIKKKTSGRKKK